MIGDGITITVQEITGHQVRIGIDAPKQLRVQRAELVEKVTMENQRAGSQAQQPRGQQIKTITFADGLIGLGDYKHFGLFQAAQASDVHILQSLDEPSLSFFVIDPCLAFPEYPVDMIKSSANLEDEEVAIAATVTVPEGGTPTVNLLAPIVMGLETFQGRQVIIDRDNLDVHHPIKLSIR